jgi:hypothetical protein
MFTHTWAIIYLFSGAGQDNIRPVGLGTWNFSTFWALEPGVLH